MANSRVVLETLRWMKEIAEKAKEEKEQARMVADDGWLKSGLDAFNKWCIDKIKLAGAIILSCQGHAPWLL